MKRSLYVVAVLAAVAAALIAAVPLVLSPAFLSSKLSEAVEAASGRKLVMGSRPRLSLWPEISVEIDDVVLANPPGMYEGRFVSMDRMRLAIGIEPLIKRRLEVRELTLVRPRIGLVIDGQGRANWSFAVPAAEGAAQAPAAETTLPLGVSLAPIVIVDGDIRFLNERSASAFKVEDVDVTVTATDPAGPVALEGHATWNGQRLALSLYAKAPQRLAGEGSPIDLSVEGALMTFAFNGLARLEEGLALAGTLEAKMPSLREAARWAGRPLPPGQGLEAFSVRGALDLQGGRIALDKATVALDGMNAQGRLTVHLDGDRPRVEASLGLDRLNVDAFFAPTEPAPQAAEGVDDWSDAAIDASGLSGLEASLALVAGEIAFGDMRIGNTRLDVSLAGGKLDARLAEMAFYDGAATGQIVLTASDGGLVLQGALRAENLDGYRLLKDFAGFERIAGKGAITLSLAARGRSERELVSTLKGSAVLRFTDGAVRGVNIAAMIRNVRSGILTGWDRAEGKDTDFALLAGSYAIEDGVATGTDLRLIGPLVRVTAEGSVDLLRRRLDYKVTPKVVASLEGQGGEEALTGLPVPVVVEGPWGEPKIYPDIKGVLDNPQAAYDALREMTGLGKQIDLEAEAAKMEEKAKAKVEETVVKEAGKAAGDEAKQLLEGVLGGKKKEPQANGQQTVQ